jgi:ankyrin repeat protein
MQELKQKYKSLYRNLFINDWILLIPQDKNKDLNCYKSHILCCGISRTEFVNLKSEKVVIKDKQVFINTKVSQILNDEIIQNSLGKILVIYLKDQEDVEWNLEKILKEIGDSEKALGKLLKLVSNFNDSAIELNNLSILQVQVKKLIQACLNGLRELDESEIFKELRKQKLEWDDFYQMVETWVIEHIYEILFYKISSFHKGLDQEFSKNMQDMQDLEFITLGLPVIDIKNAVQELKSLTILRTPVEKLNCLVKTLKLISTQNGMVVNSDFLIPLLLLTLIRSKILFLYSNWFYIKTFTFEQDLNSGQSGYALLTFEAVMAFVRNQKDHLLSLSDSVKQFFMAVNGDDLDAFKKAIALFNTPEDWKHIRNLDGETCMHIAAKNNRLKILMFTTEYDWSVRDYNENTPLHSAVEMGHVEAVQYLVSVSNVNSENALLESPIHLAAKKGNIEILKMLNDKKCDLNAVDRFGNTPLFYADINSISLFLSNGSDLNHRNNFGSTPFLYYILKGKLDLAEHLLTLPSLQVALADSGLRNCLHLACYHGYLSLCKSIISKNKVNINDQTRRGNSSLHAAVEGGFMEVVKLLLSSGADPKIRNTQGRSASDLSKNDEIKSLLNDYTIFLRQSYLAGDNVARVVLASDTDASNDAVFMVKSGQFPETSSINTVTRSLKDFIYLRNQLMVEYPEAAL